MVERKNIIFQPQEQDIPSGITVAIVGGGPAAIHLVEALRPRLGVKETIAVFEQRPRLGGGSDSSLQQFRTLQGTESLARMVINSLEWYESISKVTRFPYIWIAKDIEQLQKFAALSTRVKRWGIGKNAHILNAEEVRREFAFIDGELSGALVYPEAGRFDFEAAVDFITRRATKAKFFLRTKVGTILIERGKAIGLEVIFGNQKKLVTVEKVVLAPGPFLLETDRWLVGGSLLEDDRIERIIEVKERQSFSAFLQGLLPNFMGFFIAPGGEYVSISTDSSGNGSGYYGYADPEEPDVDQPELEPSADDIWFPALVYEGLARVISRYKVGRRAGESSESEKPTLAVRPISRKAGYYVATPDNLPIISKTAIENLYLTTAFGGEGIMLGPAAGEYAAAVVTGQISPQNNPFAINRQYQEDLGVVF